MLAFGVDIPLVEVILIFSIVIFILLVESIPIIILLVKQLQKDQECRHFAGKLSQTLLEITKAEIDELDKLRTR